MLEYGNVTQRRYVRRKITDPRAILQKRGALNGDEVGRVLIFELSEFIRTHGKTRLTAQERQELFNRLYEDPAERMQYDKYYYLNDFLQREAIRFDRSRQIIYYRVFRLMAALRDARLNELIYLQKCGAIRKEYLWHYETTEGKWEFDVDPLIWQEEIVNGNIVCVEGECEIEEPFFKHYRLYGTSLKIDEFSYLSESLVKDTTAKIILDHLKEIRTGWLTIQCHNAVIEEIAKNINMEEVKVFLCDIAPLLKVTEMLNRYILFFRDNIARRGLLKKEMQQHKLRERLEYIFSGPIDPERWKPKKTIIKKYAQRLKVESLPQENGFSLLVKIERDTIAHPEG